MKKPKVKITDLELNQFLNYHIKNRRLSDQDKFYDRVFKEIVRHFYFTSKQHFKEEWLLINFSHALDIPYTIDEVKIYEFKDFINFKLLSSSKNVIWTSQLIRTFHHKWNWDELSQNEGIRIWDFNLIKEFQEKINFDYLSCLPIEFSLETIMNFPFSIQILGNKSINLNLEELKSCIRKISHDRNGPFELNYIANIEKYEFKDLNDLLICLKSLPNLILNFQKIFENYEVYPLSKITIFSELFIMSDFIDVCHIKTLINYESQRIDVFHHEIELIREHSPDHFGSFVKSIITKIIKWELRNEPRKNSLINELDLFKYSEYFQWDGEFSHTRKGYEYLACELAKLPRVKWDVEILEKYSENWKSGYVLDEWSEADWMPGEWTLISRGYFLDHKILEQFKEKLNWDVLSSNQYINFTWDLIVNFMDYWNFTELGSNPTFKTRLPYLILSQQKNLWKR